MLFNKRNLISKIIYLINFIDFYIFATLNITTKNLNH